MYVRIWDSKAQHSAVRSDTAGQLTNSRRTDAQVLTNAAAAADASQ